MRRAIPLFSIVLWSVCSAACARPDIKPERESRPATGTEAVRATWSPLDVEALRNGRVWIPGVGVATTGASMRWDSLQGGDEWVNSDIEITLGTAPNGKKYWDVSAAYGAWMIPQPSAALEEETENYSWAGWFKPKTQPLTTSHVLWARWPEGCGATNGGNRDYVWVHAGWDALSYEFSWQGTGADVDSCNVTGFGDRGKGNLPGIEWNRWVFVRMTVQYAASRWHPAGVNYTKRGANFTSIVRIFINEEEQEGSGWSAPAPEYGGGPPEGPMRGTAVHASTAPQWLAARGYNQQGPWLVGPQYFAKGDAGPDDVWRRVMEYEAPAD